MLFETERMTLVIFNYFIYTIAKIKSPVIRGNACPVLADELAVKIYCGRL
jgi:hypothetical protein